jgi:hypothetical protein
MKKAITILTDFLYTRLAIIQIQAIAPQILQTFSQETSSELKSISKVSHQENLQ